MLSIIITIIITIITIVVVYSAITFDWGCIRRDACIVITRGKSHQTVAELLTQYVYNYLAVLAIQKLQSPLSIESLRQTANNANMPSFAIKRAAGNCTSYPKQQTR